MAGTASDELVIPDEGLIEGLAIPPEDSTPAGRALPPAPAPDQSAAEVIFEEGDDPPPPAAADLASAGPAPSPDLVGDMIARKKAKLSRSSRTDAVASASQRAEAAAEEAGHKTASDRLRQEEEWTELELKRQLKAMMDEVHTREIDDFRATYPKEPQKPEAPDVSLARSSRRHTNKASTRGPRASHGAGQGSGNPRASHGASSSNLASSRRASASAARQAAGSPPSTRALKRSGARRAPRRREDSQALVAPLLIGIAILAAVIVFFALK